MLFDGINLRDGTEITNLTVAKGNDFPGVPDEGELFYATGAGTPSEGLYIYDGDNWVVVGGGAGTVTSISVSSANGLAGTVATPTTTPAITLSTTVSGVLKGNGTAISAAVSADIDPLVAQPANRIILGSGTGLTSSSEFTYNSTTGSLNIVPSISGAVVGSTIAGASSTTNNGGEMIITGGSASAVSKNGAAVGIVGGNGGQNGRGGNVGIQGGIGSFGNTHGGSIEIFGGDGGGTGGSGGHLTLQAGNAFGNSTPGRVDITAGYSSGLTTGGLITLQTWNGGVSIKTFNTGTNDYVERTRFTQTGAISFGDTGTAYGTSGQVLTSNGNATPSWQNVSSVTQSATAPSIGGPETLWWNTDTGELFIKYNDGDSTQWVAATSIGSHTHSLTDIVSSGGFTFRNKIINGNFDIWQRGTSQTSSGYGSADRLWSEHGGATTKTASRQSFGNGQTEVPHNPTYFVRHVVTAGAGAGDFALFGQKIEDVRTLQGVPSVLSFWAKADASRNMAVEVSQNFGSGGSAGVNTYVAQVSLTTAWQRFIVPVTFPSVAGKTIGGSSFTQVNFWMDAGSSFNARTASLGHQSGTFDLAQLQLESGTVATPFEVRPVGLEADLCYRYYYQTRGEGILIASPSTQTISGEISFPVQMRAVPTGGSNLSAAQFVSADPIGTQWGIVITGVAWLTRTGGSILSVYTALSIDRAAFALYNTTWSHSGGIFKAGPALAFTFDAEL